MNISKRIFSILLAMATILCFMNVGMAASAATPNSQTIKVYAGEQAVIPFSLDNVYGADGSISYSNRALFTSLTPNPSDSVGEKVFFFDGNRPQTISFTLTATVKADAAVGSKCTVTFTYLQVEDTMGNGPDGLVKTVTVEVIEKPTPSSPSSTPSDPSSTPSTPSSTPSTPSSTPSSPSSTPSSPSSDTPPASSVPVVPSTPGESTDSKLDLTELNKQIGIANGLKSGEYTSDSWKNVKNALDAAVKARTAATQAEVDSAAKKLKDAIAALVRIDNTVLEELVGKVEEFLKSDDLSSVKEALLKAIEEAQAALKSGDQEAINKAYENLTAAFDAYKAKIKDLAQSEILEVEKEVEVEPKDPFCNIWLHKLWLILLIVSVIINLAFIALTVLYFIRRKQKYADDMPLVEYDISED